MKKAAALYLLLLAIQTSYGVVAITEFMANPEALSDSDGEWVELFNSGGSSVNLANWKLNDADIDSSLLPAYELGSGEYVLLVEGADDKLQIEIQFFNNVPQSNILIIPGFSLGNSGDELILLNEADEVQWQLAYGAGVADFAGAPGQSIYLTNNSFSVTDFGTKATPGIVLAGNDLTTPSILGYEASINGVDGAFFSETGGDQASPLAGHYTAVPEPQAGAMVAGMALLVFVIARRSTFDFRGRTSVKSCFSEPWH